MHRKCFKMHYFSGASAICRTTFTLMPPPVLFYLDGQGSILGRQVLQSLTLANQLLRREELLIINELVLYQAKPITVAVT